ncbi:unnamed protein product [Cladocopium goreaui]|uniref:Uncharacterized protein n=1 Tax=Cladocopium goreaui TaxID=2562237 RepID=A0A9P1CQV0_9DINO|nr:unnamed protein product [Cladocopium goreaui]
MKTTTVGRECTCTVSTFLPVTSMRSWMIGSTSGSCLDLGSMPCRVRHCRMSSSAWTWREWRKLMFWQAVADVDAFAIASAGKSRQEVFPFFNQIDQIFRQSLEAPSTQGRSHTAIPGCERRSWQ